MSGLPHYTSGLPLSHNYEPIYPNREIELSRIFKLFDLGNYDDFNNLSNDARSEFVNRLSRNLKIDSILNE